MKITVEMLIAARACENQVELFQELFGEGGEVTLESCRQAAAAGLNLHWAAAELFSEARPPR